MRLICLGNGDAFSALRYSSTLAVESQGRWLLIDCPHPIRKILRESGTAAGVALDVGDFEAVVLTHLHGDHVSGLEGFLYYSRMVLGRSATVVAHPEVLGDLWDHLLRPTIARPRPGPDGKTTPARRADAYGQLPLDEAAPVTLGPFAITCRRTSHPIPTFALRIAAGGRVLALSADTGYDPALIDWLARDAHLIVHETNHGIHTPYEALAELPAELRHRMRLIHYPDDFDVPRSAIEPLLEGRSYRV